MVGYKLDKWLHLDGLYLCGMLIPHNIGVLKLNTLNKVECERLLKCIFNFKEYKTSLPNPGLSEL